MSDEKLLKLCEKYAVSPLSKVDLVEQRVPGHGLDKKSLAAGPWQDFAKDFARLYLSPEVQIKLLQLQNRGLDVNAILMELIEEREQKIALHKEWLSIITEQTGTRYIPIAARDLLKEEYGTKCSIETCPGEAEEIHHTQRFGLSKNNNPLYLAPLCKEHHQIAHSIDVKVQEIKTL